MRLNGPGLGEREVTWQLRCPGRLAQGCLESPLVHLQHEGQQVLPVKEAVAPQERLRLHQDEKRKRALRRMKLSVRVQL
jgi:hypothetical protein